VKQIAHSRFPEMQVCPTQITFKQDILFNIGRMSAFNKGRSIFYKKIHKQWSTV